MASRAPRQRRSRLPGEPLVDASVRPSPSLEYPKDLEVAAFALGGDKFLLLTFPADHENFSSLTTAEQEIASELLRGKSYRQVARLRGSTYGTVANQVRSIFRKLQVRSRSELARVASFNKRPEPAEGPNREKIG